jgi:hypothetical protein
VADGPREASSRHGDRAVPVHKCGKRRVIVSTDRTRLTALVGERCRSKFIDATSSDMGILENHEFLGACDTCYILVAMTLDVMKASWFPELIGIQSLN